MCSISLVLDISNCSLDIFFALFFFFLRAKTLVFLEILSPSSEGAYISQEMVFCAGLFFLFQQPNFLYKVLKNLIGFS